MGSKWVRRRIWKRPWFQQLQIGETGQEVFDPYPLEGHGHFLVSFRGSALDHDALPERVMSYPIPCLELACHTRPGLCLGLPFPWVALIGGAGYEGALEPQTMTHYEFHVLRRMHLLAPIHADPSNQYSQIPPGL